MSGEPENAGQRGPGGGGEEMDGRGYEFEPGVTVGSLRRFRAALIGSTQGLPKRCRLRR